MFCTDCNRVVFGIALNWSERADSAGKHLGGILKKKKEQDIHKEECRKPDGSFLYGRVRLDHHTQTELMKQQEWRPNKAMLRDPRLKLPRPPQLPYSPAMFYRLGCINHSSLINLQECCPGLPPLHNVKQGVLFI